MDYTGRKGLLTELACELAFSEVGIVLSKPIIACRYDYIAEINEKLYRIQCKSSTPKDDNYEAFTFSVSNKNWNNGQKRSYQGEVDFFFTTFEEENYLIPIEDVGVSNKTLRLKAKLNEKNIS